MVAGDATHDHVGPFAVVCDNHTSRARILCYHGLVCKVNLRVRTCAARFRSGAAVQQRDAPVDIRY
eukprot:140603-Prymnesium_polylepis.2